MRLRKKWWARPMLEESPLVIINPKEKKGKWSEEFKNSNPIYLELGCGRGRFISTHGENNPSINYIAIDIKDEVLIYTLKNVQEKEIENVRIIPLEIAFKRPFQPKEPSISPIIPANTVPPINTIITLIPTNARIKTNKYGMTLIKL